MIRNGPLRQDVFSGLLPPISAKTQPHFGHLIMWDARCTSSFRWILLPHIGQGGEKSKWGSPWGVAPSSRPSVCRPHRLPDEQVREPAQEHLRRQVSPMLATQWTLGGDRLRWHRLNRRRDVLSAALASDDHPP